MMALDCNLCWRNWAGNKASGRHTDLAQMITRHSESFKRVYMVGITFLAAADERDCTLPSTMGITLTVDTSEHSIKIL